MRSKSRTRAMAVAALAASVSLAGLTTVATPAGAAPAATEREAGTTRYGTAAEAALRAFPTANTVVVTTGERVPDALSANPIAGENDAPILLVTQNSVPAETAAAMAQIDPDNVIIVGGTAAVSEAVATALGTGGATVTREAGTDRFKTAAEVARAVGEAPAIDADGAGAGTARPTVALANGVTGLADAVAASPMLHQEEIPLLLTSGDTLNADAAAVIDELDATQVILLGGTAAIPASVQQSLATGGANVVRLGGADRFDTAGKIADFETDFLGFDAATTFLANGFAPAPRDPNDLVDALSGGPLASDENGPILLVTRDALTAPTAAWLKANAADVDKVVAIGGTGVISDATLTAAAAAADENATPAAAGTTVRPELVSAAIVGTVTPAQQTPSSPPGTTVRFVFDEQISGAFADAGDFVLYDWARNEYYGDAAVLDPSNTRSALVRFDDIINAAGSVQASDLTLASVFEGAVVDGEGDTNPIGDAAIGTSSTRALNAGSTLAPDVVSVAARGAAATAGDTVVDFVFDEAAFVTSVGGFSLVLTDGSVSVCVAPAVGGTTPPSGGTSPGGNGTTTITVTCDNAAAAPLTPIATAGIARGVVAEGTVSDAQQVDDDAGTAGFQNTITEGNANPLQVTNTPDANTPGADLVSAAFFPNGGAADQVLYTFDEAVLVDVGSFNIYDSSGGETSSTTAQRSPTNDTQVLVTFSDEDLLSAVGASVDADAVREAAGAGNQNEADEVGVANSATTTIQPGQTLAPELTNVVLTRATNNFGQTVWSATYVFDEDLDHVDDAADLVLYLADGTRLECQAFLPTSNGDGIGDTEDTDNTVTCVSFFNTATSATASAIQVGSAVLGGAENDNVDEDDSNGGHNTLTAAPTQGGTGTPAA